MTGCWVPMDPLYKAHSDRAVGSISLESFLEWQETWQAAGFDCSWVGLLRKSPHDDQSALERPARFEAAAFACFQGMHEGVTGLGGSSPPHAFISPPRISAKFSERLASVYRELTCCGEPKLPSLRRLSFLLNKSQ